LRNNGVDILLVERSAVVGNGEFTVRGQSSTVTVWKIVNDQGQNELGTSSILLLDVGGISGNGWDLGAGVEPDKGANLSNAGCLCGPGCATLCGESRDGGAGDLRRVVRVGIEAVARQRVVGVGRRSVAS
jgi:hypothetical protein